MAPFIVTLVLGGILAPLTTQVEPRQISDPQKLFGEIKEAIFVSHVAARSRASSKQTLPLSLLVSVSL